ncbi:MAG: hypothetical protein IPO58_01915 [Betaproteobacteria bacterium]|nr:hypothetical protein [Betaproteobacteria bacterium]
MQDADNLGGKLDLILYGLAPVELLESYNAERVEAADENILTSTRSTMPPRATSCTFRDAIRSNSRPNTRRRKLVVSGRLSPTRYADSPPNTADAEPWAPGTPGPGSPATDAPWYRPAASPAGCCGICGRVHGRRVRCGRRGPH